MNIKRSLHIILFLFYLVAPLQLSAHESRPLFIQIESTQRDTFEVSMNIPASVGQGNLPRLLLPSHFHESEHKIKNIPNGILKKYRFKASSEDLIGQKIGIEYPRYNPVISTIFQIKIKDFPTITQILSPDQTNLIIPREPNTWQAVKSYTILGIKHIWEGIDHLLFVACLVLIAGFTKKLLLAVTGFTLAHSLTLALAALDLINLPLPPIEACIALSIVFLCYEIIHHHRNKSSLTYRQPIAVSSSFGLLHGLGFASVLSDIGLPHATKIPALVSFNIGVEIGQILFIGALFFLFFIIKKIPYFKQSNWAFKAIRLGTYFIGIIAAYWFFDRILV